MKGTAKKNRLWIFDFDGTLSEIVPNRHDALLDASCREMLERLIKQHDGHVAILSSREIHDLADRADIPGIYLGGSSGMEWILPDGERRSFLKDFDRLLHEKRSALFAEIKKLQLIHDLDVEDKTWSMTFHLRNTDPEKKEWIPAFIKNWETRYAIKVLEGPEALEAHFLPELNKSFGVQKFCEITGATPETTHIVYAGDDENDAIAMQWVVERGGIAYTVGVFPLVPGSRTVRKPFQLPSLICQLLEEGVGGISTGGLSA